MPPGAKFANTFLSMAAEHVTPACAPVDGRSSVCMTETPACPSVGHMAEGAICSQALFVMVIALATDVTRRHVLERRGFVASLASHAGMRGLVMVLLAVLV